MILIYRPTTTRDEEFLYQLHRATMRTYVEETWGMWDEDWQQTYFHQHFIPEDLLILQLDGVDIGVISVQERTEELFLGIVQILPSYQRQGIGTTVIRDLLTRAARQGKPVALKVLKSNRLARSLYQRLGFGVTGETATHYVMAWMKGLSIE
ncbi:MAG: GNAT family N-acetyltransferase [Anaerolineaceae bacterium]|nr:GNAT family N-acetyltransferase [Anaerolineaceae bacterium]